MCSDCRSHSLTVANNVWATPVHPVKLLAHLQVYTETKATINSFRLSCRLGTGPNVFVTNMPQELVDMVVNEILRPARTAVYKYWDELFACAKERCRYRDHFSEEEKEELRPEMEDIWRQGAAEGADFSLDDVLLEHLDSCGSDSVYGLHLDLSRWIEAGKFKHYPGDFDKYEKVLDKDFGLSAWISHQKTPSTLRTIFPSPGSLTPGEERETTVGFLKLPGKHHKEDASVYTSEDQYSSDGERRYTYDSTLSMLVDPKALEISKEQRSRFARAMQALGLEPFVHPTQLIAPGHKWFRVGKSKHSMERVFLCKGHNKPHSTQYPDAIEKEHNRIEEHVKNLEESSWPKLMSLVNTNYT
ncbi:hypothetical protein LTS18_002799, partial [Coniosporium uncinatum]